MKKLIVLVTLVCISMFSIGVYKAMSNDELEKSEAFVRELLSDPIVLSLAKAWISAYSSGAAI